MFQMKKYVKIYLKILVKELKKQKKSDKDFSYEKVDCNYLLNEESQLNNKLKYSLKKLPIYVGRKLGNPIPEIKLSGIRIK